MFRFGSALSSLERHVGAFSVEALAGVLRPAWVEEALRETGRASRRIRALPADLVVWLLVAMGVWRGSGIRNVLFRLGTGVRRSLRWKGGQAPPSNAVTKARDRLGVEPVQHLFGRLCDSLRDEFAAVHAWKGMALLAVDGTTLKMPDSPRNRAHFGAPGAGRGRSAFPQMRVVVMMAAVTHVVLAAAMAPCTVGESTLARALFAQAKPGMLLLLDRGFINYGVLWDLQRRGVHFVVRAKRTVRLRRRKSLGAGGALAEVLFGRTFRRLHRGLPAAMPVRVVTYRVPGFRPVRLLTSLLDAAAFPAHEIAARYRDRWEIELGYDEIKTHLSGVDVPLRSAAPERVLQEAYGLLLAYDVVRALMARAAGAAGIDPRRLSFTDALERLRHLVLLMALVPGRVLPSLYAGFLLELACCVLPPRRQRRYPRAVKVTMNSKYLLNRRHHAA